MFNISDRVYDILKWAVSVVLPALAALYAALSGVFGWPASDQVSSTIMAVVMFLGAFLQMNSAAYALRQVRSYADENNDGIPDYPFKMSGQLYDTVKWFAQVLLPALSVGYVGLAGIWGWPYAEQVPTVVSAVVLFMGTVLQFSSAAYREAKASVGL